MPKLYAVLLGGRALGCNTELHDVVFVVGDTIEETYPLLVNKWFGMSTRLHIDSSVELNYINGHKITLSKQVPKTKAEKSLYFINMGGYQDGVFGEIHDMGFFIGTSKEDVLSKAKNILGKNLSQQHCDDNLNILNLLDDDIIKTTKVDDFYIGLEEVNIPHTLNKIISNYRRLDVPDILKKANMIK